jgi:large subunit ribosomal protein L30
MSNMSKKIVIKQVRSDAGCVPTVRRTIKAVGLGRIGKSREIVSNEAVMGMLRRVSHLIEISPAKITPVK